MCMHRSSCLCIFPMIVCACLCFCARVCTSLSAWLCVFCGALISEWSWRLLLTLISPEISSSLPGHSLSSRSHSLFFFLSFRSHFHKTAETPLQQKCRSDTFSKVGQSLGKVTQGLDYNTPICSDCAFRALWIFTLNPIWITLCKAPLETTHPQTLKKPR